MLFSPYSQSWVHKLLVHFVWLSHFSIKETWVWRIKHLFPYLKSTVGYPSHDEVGHRWCLSIIFMSCSHTLHPIQHSRSIHVTAAQCGRMMVGCEPSAEWKAHCLQGFLRRKPLQVCHLIVTLNTTANFQSQTSLCKQLHSGCSEAFLHSEEHCKNKVNVHWLILAFLWKISRPVAIPPYLQDD